MISTASAHLAPKEHCTGCSACASGCPRGAIKMVADKEGFLYPQVTDACVHCGHCTHICPALKHREQRPEPTVFAVWNEDEAQRRLSTSGGAFAAIAGFVLESGGVVFGAAMDGDMRVVHTAIQSKEDLPRLMGTKLVQSDMGECFQQVRYYLDRGTFVFFTGTPCQVDGLYRYLGESPELLLTADTLCSGVPSPGVWSKVVDAMHYIKQRRVTAVQFCKKLTGSESRFVVDFEGGGQYDAPLGKSDYGRGLFRGLFLRPACYHCTCCSTNRVADLTFGSFKGLPSDFYPQQQKLGVSMLLINTVKGAHIFDMIPLHREKRTPPRISTAPSMPPWRRRWPETRLSVILQPSPRSAPPSLMPLSISRSTRSISAFSPYPIGRTGWRMRESSAISFAAFNPERRMRHDQNSAAHLLRPLLRLLCGAAAHRGH